MARTQKTASAIDLLENVYGISVAEVREFAQRELPEALERTKPEYQDRGVHPAFTGYASRFYREFGVADWDKDERVEFYACAHSALEEAGDVLVNPGKGHHLALTEWGITPGKDGASAPVKAAKPKKGAKAQARKPKAQKPKAASAKKAKAPKKAAAKPKAQAQEAEGPDVKGTLVKVAGILADLAEQL